jgi:hypothetical protein
MCKNRRKNTVHRIDVFTEFENCELLLNRHNIVLQSNWRQTLNFTNDIDIADKIISHSLSVYVRHSDKQKK